MKIDAKTWLLTTDTSPEKGERTSSEFMDAQVALAAPRHLMTSLRKIMSGTDSANVKLEEIVALVARELRADACSCFVMRAGETLELFAASGLIEGLVHQLKVRVGEGPVGDIAAQGSPIISSDKKEHSFSLGSKGEGFKSFCGVPILRGGVVRGVLVVQNQRKRNYSEEVVDILQTVSTLVAELIVSGKLLTIQEMSSGLPSGEKPTRIEGTTLGRGLAIGQVVLYERRLEVQDIVAEDSKNQKFRLRQAVASMHQAINQMIDHEMIPEDSETRDILEAYKMFARDRGWLSRIESAIDKGLSAEAAVQTVLNETRARMLQIKDNYIRERLEDLEDVSNRLLSYLIKQQNSEVEEEVLPENIILVARSMGPAALLDYDRNRLKAVVLEKGSHSNHVAIVARSLGIPVVGKCGDVLNYVEAGDQVIVDGDHGVVYIRPSQYVLDLYMSSIELRAKRTHMFRRVQNEPAVTKDGVKISVQMNAGLLEDVPLVNEFCADGIGLFRTELAFMGFKKYPSVAKQTELYRQILDQTGDKPVVFRTLDIGGDKPLPYFDGPEEENPVLGWRAVRIGMDRPAILRTQFRAFIRAAEGRNLKIMLPLVTEVAEFDRARRLLEMEKARALKSEQKLPTKIELGVMLEVPALLWQLETLLEDVDFVSVGTNDLMQYLYVADRGNDHIRDRYDCLSPAMLRVLKMIADKSREAGVPVSVCGEMAGTSLEAMVLLALGYQNISVSAQSIEMVKMMIPTLDTHALLLYIERLMKSREHSLRERLMSFARDHQVSLT